MEKLICVNFMHFWDFQIVFIVAPVQHVAIVELVIARFAFVIAIANIIKKFIEAIILQLKIIEIVIKIINMK